MVYTYRHIKVLDQLRIREKRKKTNFDVTQ
jgi:hypothetical protein